MRSVVDENVLRTANGEATHASYECQLACIDFLEACASSKSLLLDAEHEILTTYGQSCSYSGQPGPGDEFFRWAHEAAGTLEQVSVPRDEDGEFVHFPVAALPTFDADDRKWVALAVAAGPPSRIVNAVDSDYAQHAAAFAAEGIEILELCPGDLKES